MFQSYISILLLWHLASRLLFVVSAIYAKYVLSANVFLKFAEAVSVIYIAAQDDRDRKVSKSVLLTCEWIMDSL